MSPKLKSALKASREAKEEPAAAPAPEPVKPAMSSRKSKDMRTVNLCVPITEEDDMRLEWLARKLKQTKRAFVRRLIDMGCAKHAMDAEVRKLYQSTMLKAGETGTDLAVEA